jgi:hypothetical protein
MKMSRTEALVPKLFDFRHIFGLRGDPRTRISGVSGKVGVREGPSAAGTYSAIQAANLTTNFLVL